MYNTFKWGISMNKRKKQGQPKRKLNIGVCFMIGLIMYLCCALISQQTSLHSSKNQKISQLEAEIVSAESKLAEVQDMDAFSKSDEYIERVAREKLGLVLPDETVFVDVTGR